MNNRREKEKDVTRAYSPADSEPINGSCHTKKRVQLSKILFYTCLVGAFYFGTTSLYSHPIIPVYEIFSFIPDIIIAGCLYLVAHILRVDKLTNWIININTYLLLLLQIANTFSFIKLPNNDIGYNPEIVGVFGVIVWSPVIAIAEMMEYHRKKRSEQET